MHFKICYPKNFYTYCQFTVAMDPTVEIISS